MRLKKQKKIAEGINEIDDPFEKKDESQDKPNTENDIENEKEKKIKRNLTLKGIKSRKL